MPYQKIVFFAVVLTLVMLLITSCGAEQKSSITPEITPTIVLTPTATLLPTLTPTQPPVKPTLVAVPTVNTDSTVQHIELIGYIGEEVASFAAPSSTVGFNSPGLARDVVVEGEYAYVVQGADGPAGTLWGRLSVVDVSDPKAPQVVGFYEPDNIASDIVVISDTAYLTDGRCEFGAAACWGGLHILDVSAPTSPVQVGVYNLNDIQAEYPTNQSWYASSVAVIGNYAYVTGGPFYDPQPGDEFGLRIVDISEVANSTVIGVMQCRDANATWQGYSVEVQDDYAYIAAGDAGLRIVNVSNRISPTEVGHINKFGAVRDIAIEDGYAYIAADEAGLQIVDTSKPNSLSRIGSFRTRGRAVGITIVDSYAYVAAGDAGLRVIDVSDPANPIETGFYETSGWVTGVTVVNGYIYVADVERGLFILQVISPH